ncbi:Phosphoglucomutase/phosphomannomutase [uncultured archaeon]|nr:Phosphoglucomutase/phosphomannomutase [uncultured archaeon]
MAKYFGTYGVRGKLDLLTPEFVSALSAAFATSISKKGGKIVVGTDARTSREMVESAAIAGLISAGCEVVDLGVAPSPTVEFEVKRMGADGGIIVTASHNPPEWNALKFMGKEGVGISREKGEAIEKIFEAGKQRRAEWSELKEVARYKLAVRDHMQEVLKRVDPKPISKRKPFVVLDCGNGVAGGFVPYLFRELGCRVVTLNAQADGFFPGRNSEPTRENVEGLVKCVKALSADLGIAWDGDGDRVIFIDEKGGYVWGDKSFALCAKIMLREKMGTVVTTVATGNVVKDAVEKAGGKIDYVTVGAPYIAERMAAAGAVLGGEEVGGVVWPEICFGKDGFMTAAKIVEDMCASGKPLSKLVGELPEYFNAKTKVETGKKDKGKILAAIRKEFSGVKGATANLIDGVRLDFSDGSWVIARPSGTENFFRVFSEAKTQGKADALLSGYKKRVEEIIASA